MKRPSSIFIIHQFPLWVGVLACAILGFGTTQAQAAACNVSASPPYLITVNAGSNPAGCELSSVQPVIGDNNVFAVGFTVFSQNTSSRTLTVLDDLTTTVRGVQGTTPAARQ